MYLVLASKSPRRKEILTQAGYDIKIDPSDADENVEETDPILKVQAIAKKKGLAVFSKYSDADAVIISADTIVVVDNQILGKPKDKDDARRMINLLQGNTHHVYTGVFIQSVYGQDMFYDDTLVNISSMTDEEIEEYISTTEPYDKAGSYAIQGIFSKYINSINGDYYNVMGLPINKVRDVLKKYNFVNRNLGLNEEKPNIKICSNCGNSNDEKNKYCKYCGSLLVSENNSTQIEGECPICHHVNSSNSGYCEICGTILTSNKNFTIIKNPDQNFNYNYMNGNNDDRFEKKMGKDFSIPGLILGIVTLALNITCLGAFISAFTGIISIVFNSITIYYNNRNGKAITGLVTGIVGLILSIILIVVMLSGTSN